jgi:Tol biopolymer transport system component
MDTTLRPRLFNAPRASQVLLVAAIVLALVGAALLYAGTHQTHLPPPFGPARNGLLLSSADGDIFSVDPVTLAKHDVIAGGTFDFGPTFSRDGTMFMFLRGAPPDCGRSDCGLMLMVANADGSGIRQLTPGLQMLDWLDWSPDGSQIAIDASTPSMKGHVLMVINLDGSPARTYDLGRPIHEMSWLPPDGKEIVFRGEQLNPNDPPVGIFAVDVATGTVRQVVVRAPHSDDDFQGVAVSPDGTRIGYRDDGAAGGFRQHIFDLRTGLDTILRGPLGQWGGGFSPDGTEMVFIRNVPPDKFQLMVEPIDGSRSATALGPVVGLGSDGPSMNNYGWTPDGTAILANYDAENEALLLPIDGSPPVVLIHGGMAMPGQQRLAP